MTNEIQDDTINGKFITHTKNLNNKPQCVICEFIMTELEHVLENKTTEDDIKNAVHHICNDLPKSVKKDCNNFVNQYADMVIQLLIQSLKPDEICAVLKLCDEKSNACK